MDDPLSTAIDAARRILAAARPGERDATATVGRVFVRLRDQLGRWVGADAFDALAGRACSLIRSTHPAWSAVAWLPGASPPLQGLDGPEDVVLEGGVVLIVTLTELLGRFVGDEIALRLLLDGWFEDPDVSAPSAEKDDG